MIARISLKLKASPKTSPKANPAFDSAKLSTPAIRNVFALTLSNKFEALALDDDTDTSLESTWNTIKEVYSQTAAATVEYAKRPKDQWLSERTWNLIGDRRNLKQQLLNCGEYNDAVLKNQLYRDLDKLVKRRARGDKHNLLEEKAAMAEEAAKRGDSRAVYKITNEIVGKSRNVNGPVKDASGKTVTDPLEIAKVWTLHFEKVLNRPRPLDPPDIPVTPCLNLQISNEEPSDVEISQAACKLKNGRAAGTDRISVEMIKASLSVCMTVWLTLFASIWKSEKVPDDWTKRFGIRIGEVKKLADLDFADDIALMERNKAKLQDLLNTIRENASRLGLKINTEKTKSMATTDYPLDMKCGDSTIEKVVEFRYLGNTVENSGSSEREVQQKIGQASGAFNRLKPVWRSKKYSLKLKLRLINSNVLSAFLYSSEMLEVESATRKTDPSLRKQLPSEDPEHRLEGSRHKPDSPLYLRPTQGHRRHPAT
ncbi:uncharacterized protein LOC136040034 [Artemia franciscana]|uniref:uncharacterized protein LOC136040034 n=1 Tax=Artemia franciscana TaxID=6661 RepID=UPI0032D9D758